MYKKIVVTALMLIIILIFMSKLDVNSVFSVDNLIEHKDELISFTEDYWLISAIVYGVTYIVFVAVGLPVFIFYAVAAGLMFGFLLGSVLTMGASVIGATMTFLVVRHFLWDHFNRRYAKQIERFEKRLHRSRFRVLVVTRMFPGSPYFFITVMAALSKITSREFTLATLIGNVPKKLMLVYIGHYLRSVEDMNEFISPHLILPLIGIGLILIMGYVINRLIEHRHKEEA